MVAVRPVGLADEPDEEDQRGADEKVPHAHLQLAILGVAVVEDKIEGLGAGEGGRGLVCEVQCEVQCVWRCQFSVRIFDTTKSWRL